MQRSPRGRPVDPEARSARRRQILDAARGCVAQKGFHAASTAEISVAAGVSVANLYQYFSAKDDLVIAMAEDDLGADLRHVARLADAADLVEGVKALLIDIDREARDPLAVRLRVEIYAEATRNPRVQAVLAENEKALLTHLAVIIREAQSRGQASARLDPDDTAVVLLCLVDGLYGRSAVGPDKDPVDAVSAAVAQLLRPADPPDAPANGA